MDDRRENDRIDAHHVGLQAVNGIDGETLGIVSNLSLGGMMLITNRELYADGVLQLKLDAPDHGAIPMGVKVLWCTPANSPDEFWGGLTIIDISPADREALERLLDYLADDR